MLLMTLTTSVPNTSPWIATPILLFGMVFVLGFLLAINLKIKTDNISNLILYSIGLGLSFLILGGLGINWLFPYWGISHPLAKLPLISFFDSIIILLTLCVYVFNKNYILLFKLKLPNKRSLFFGILPLFFLLMSVLGSQMLNNFGSGALTLTMLLGIGVYVIALTCFGKSVQGWVYFSAIYITSLSLLLMYSLRSTHILGWDINQEYQVFYMTLQNLVWKMSYYPGTDYNSCLSITILPTILRELTNIPSEYVFKTTFQILFATTPVVIYAFARRYLKEGLAFLATFLLISQAWFFEQMPALIRQEMAFLFFAMMLLAIFDEQLTKRMRFVLLYIFTIALILSHYSTAYVWLALLFGVLTLSYVIKYFIPHFREQSPLIKPAIFIISIVFLFIWEVPITHTGYAITNFATHKDTEVTKTSTNLLGTKTETVSKNNIETSTTTTPNFIKAGVTKILFTTTDTNSTQNIILARNRAIDTYIKRPGQTTYSDIASQNYIPTEIDDRAYLDPKLPDFLSKIINLITKISKFLLIGIFPLIGIIGIFLNLRKNPSSQKYNLIIFGTVAYILIVLMIFIPYLQIYYNFTRLYLQMFFILSTLSVIGGVMTVKYLPKYQTLTLAVMAVIIFYSLSGALDQLTGGQKRMTLNNTPAIFDTYYIHDTEIAGAKWLSKNRDNTMPIRADIIANLRLQSFGNINADGLDIFPQTIEKESYVYLIKSNIVKESAFIQYENNLFIYKYPLNFLNTHKNLVYNNGGSRIYK
jgi:uncharacterized membrane protein